MPPVVRVVCRGMFEIGNKEDLTKKYTEGQNTVNLNDTVNTDRISIQYRSNIDDTLQAVYWEIYTNALLQQRNF